MLKEFCKTTDLTDTFIGLHFVDSKPQVVFPRGFRLSEDDKGLRRDILALLSVLSKFSDLRQGNEIAQINGVNNKVDFPLLSYQYIIYNFLNHGYYTENEIQHVENNRGKIDWKRTIQKEHPWIDNGNIVYLKFIVKTNKINDNSLLTKIHKYCVYESFSRLGWLYLDSLYLPPKPTYNLDKGFAILTLKQAIKNTFNENKKRLFHSMINVLMQKDSDNDTLSNVSYGVDKFEYVWEKLIDHVFSNESNKSSYFPTSKWYIVASKETYGNSELRPDTIIKVGDKLFIVDAKYYKYGITGNPNHLPETDSIQKQITYGKYATEKKGYKRTNVYNAFVMPYDNKGSGENYKFVSVATSDWEQYPSNYSYTYIIGILMDTRHIITTYSQTNETEIQKLTKLIVDSLAQYRIASEN